MFNRLVNGLAAAEPEPAIKPHRRLILRGDLQECSRQTGLPESAEGLQHEVRAEPKAAMAWTDPQILNRAPAGNRTNALHGADILGTVSEKPGGAGQESGL